LSGLWYHLPALQNRNKARVKIGEAKTNEGNRYVGVYSFSRGIFEMKRIALAVLLALCGARIYGAVPVEQPKLVVTQEDVKNVQKLLNDTKSIDALADQLGLPKEEVKGWFSRHKVITTSASILAVYAALYGVSRLGDGSINWGKDGKRLASNGGVFKVGDQEAPDTLVKLSDKIRYYLSYLAWAQKPVAFAGTQIKDHYFRTALILLALFAIYELYQGKDSAVAHGLNWVFGKDAVEEAQLVAALAAAEATPVPAKVEEVAVPVVVATPASAKATADKPVENKVEEVTPVVTPVENKVEEVVSVVETPAQTKVEEVTPVVTPAENKVEEVVSVVETPALNKVEDVVVPVVVAAVENKVEEVTPVVTPVENKVEEVVSVVETPALNKVEEVVVPVVVAAVENKVEEVMPVVTPAENKVEEVVSVVETPALNKVEEVVVPVVVAAVENKVEEVMPVVTPAENKVEAVVPVVETPAQTKVEEVPAIAAAA
jgi:hypothetical protein